MSPASLKVCLSLFAIIVLQGCSPSEDDIHQDDLWDFDLVGCELNSKARNIDDISVKYDQVAVGVFSNALLHHDDALYVVASGDNLVQRIDLQEGLKVSTFVDLGPDQNPYDMATDGERFYISALLSDSLFVVDKQGALLSQVQAQMTAPQDLLVVGDRVLVAATGFSSPMPPEPFGEVLVMSTGDSPQVINRLQPSASNPQFLVATQDELIVISSGATSYDPTTQMVLPQSPGAVDFFWLDSLDSASAPSQSLSIKPQGRYGNPGKPALIGDVLYLGSGTGPALYSLSLSQQSWLRGPQDPIILPNAPEGNALVAPYALGDLLGVLDFNSDRLWLYDPSCDQPLGEPIELGRRDTFLEGPLDLVMVDNQAYVLMTLASSINRVDLSALW